VPRTSKDYIAPEHHIFCDPDDIEKDCNCTASGSYYSCDIDETHAKPCKDAGGRCYVVVAPPNDPHLLLPKHKSEDGHRTDDELALPPGWEAFCACLKYKEPTAAEIAKWPTAPEWKPPEGYTFTKGAKPCGMPVPAGLGGRDWKCPDDDCTLVGVPGKKDEQGKRVTDKDGKTVRKEGETQLVKLADPKGTARPKNVDPMWAIFCVHLDKT
jgi:hypothetical protein